MSDVIVDFALAVYIVIGIVAILAIEAFFFTIVTGIVRIGEMGAAIATGDGDRAADIANGIAAKQAGAVRAGAKLLLKR